MKSIVLSLNMAEYVKDFVQIVTKYNYDMDLRCGRYVVDAKSILGIFSLDLNSPSYSKYTITTATISSRSYRRTS